MKGRTVFFGIGENGVSSVMIVDNPSRKDENWMYFATKATLNF